MTCAVAYDGLLEEEAVKKTQNTKKKRENPSLFVPIREKRACSFRMTIVPRGEMIV